MGRAIELRKTLIGALNSISDGESNTAGCATSPVTSWPCVVFEFGANPNEGIWPHRDATSPRVIAHERGYEEISAASSVGSSLRCPDTLAVWAWAAGLGADRQHWRVTRRRPDPQLHRVIARR